MKMKTNKSPNEAAEQRTLFEWASRMERRFPELQLMFHIANGGSRDYREAHNLKLQGVKPGVPDICLPVPKGIYAALYIELKRKEGGKVSDAQRGWIKALNNAGNKAVICKGFDEAREAIIEYLNEGRKDF